MRILIFTPAFLPMIGGLENMAYMLANEWSQTGNEITVITKALQVNFEDEKEPFKIIRNPSHSTYWRIYLENDVIFFLNISLNGIWPALLRPKPTFISHQITYYNLDGKISFLEQIKRQMSRLFINISCSNFVRSTLPNKTGFVIPNAYNSNVFFNYIPFEKRKKDIVFVGRLVSDKGIDTLIKSLALIKIENDLKLNLSIIGEGPELYNLKKLVLDLNLSLQIKFLGSIINSALANEINEHKIMVVPSKWKEPFGLVALEGLACGCKMVVSRYGGLVEATGTFAHEFVNGTVESLANAILTSNYTRSISNLQLEQHLIMHNQKNIANQYLSLIKNMTNKRNHV
jgi:glycosyltransferase involved in cell wall biosynthesis